MKRQRKSSSKRCKSSRPRRISAKKDETEKIPPLRRSPRKNRGPYSVGSSPLKRITKAKTAVNQGMKVRVASYVYGVKKSTLQDHVKKDSIKPVGRPPQLSQKEENAIVDHLKVQSDWGFPLTRMEVQLAVKGYLDKKNVTESRFKDNLPGRDWTSAFLKRHTDLNARIPRFIKSARAQVGPEVIQKYFSNLGDVLQDVPPENILNYDETNLADNPANEAVIYRREIKHLDKVMTTSKSATSLMFAGTASGELLPVYTVYKSKHLTESWTTGGPERAYYNRTKSGWFDKVTFEDWFVAVVLPWAKRHSGQKVVIGDNLPSQFSEKVLNLCQENSISFVCLPANSTHLLQPLDVAFFGPLKRAWRKVLGTWKEHARNRDLTLPKSEFPKLLKQLLIEIDGRKERNLRVAFRKTGIHPLNQDEVLQQLPGGIASPSAQQVYQRMSDSFLQALEAKRYQAPTRKRGKRLTVSPGKSWCPPAISAPEPEEDVDSPDPLTPRRSRRILEASPRGARGPHQGTAAAGVLARADAAVRQVGGRAARSTGRRRLLECEFAGEASEAYECEGDHVLESTGSVNPELIQPKPGDWVLVQFAGKRKINFSVGFVQAVDRNFELECKFLKPCGKGVFQWPENDKINTIDYDTIQKILPNPTIKNERGKNRKEVFQFSASFEGFSII